MNKIKKFEEYIENKVVKKRGSDKIKAQDLTTEAEKDKKFLEEIKKKIPLNDDNANNFIEQVYKIILKTIRARMMIDGYKATGHSAHEAEVAYMINLGFSEAETEFMDEIRYSRNGILYYGSSFNKDYAEKILVFFEKIYPRLKKMVESN